MRRLRLPILGALLVLISGPALGATEAEVNAQIGAMLGKPALYETSIELFQQSVARGVRADVAAFVRYPIVVDIGGHKRMIRSPRSFRRRYDAIMTPDLVRSVTRQRYGDLRVDRHGIRFDGGVVRFFRSCLDRRCRRFVPLVVALRHSVAD